MISIVNLSFSFGKKEILKNINIDIECPSIFKISGNNGSGKTSLLKCVAGLYNNFEGNISFDFNENGVSFLFNDPSFYPNLSVIENIRILNYYLNQKEIRKKVQSLIEKLSFEKFYSVKAAKLSDGNKQKLKIIIAFLKNSNVYILDEPINNLDTDSIKIIYEYIFEEYKLSNKTFLIVSHNDKFLNSISTDEYNLKQY